MKKILPKTKLIIEFRHVPKGFDTKTKHKSIGLANYNAFQTINDNLHPNLY